MQIDLETKLSEWSEEKLGMAGISKSVVSYSKLKGKLICSLKDTYTEQALLLLFNPENMNKMVSPNGFSRIKGPCGDTMEFYLKIEENRIISASFQTDGCSPSIISGEMVSRLVKGQTIEKAARIEQDDVLRAIGGLPEESEHCALLAVNTLKMAIENALKGR